MTEIFIGLDGEMTGTELSCHSLIQIGAALSEEAIFGSIISWDTFQYDPESLRLIGRTVISVRSGPSAADVDDMLVNWLTKNNLIGKKIVPVGWGVSSFDRPFISKTLPRFHSLLHHHSVELNAVVYTLAGTCTYLGEQVDFSCWKRMAKKMAALTVLNATGIQPREHDAADDALLALLAWRWMRQVIAGQSIPSGNNSGYYDDGRHCGVDLGKQAVSFTL